MIYFWALLALLALGVATVHMASFLRKRMWSDAVITVANLGAAIFAVINMAGVLR